MAWMKEMSLHSNLAFSNCSIENRLVDKIADEAVEFNSANEDEATKTASKTKTFNISESYGYLGEEYFSLEPGNGWRLQISIEYL